MRETGTTQTSKKPSVVKRDALYYQELFKKQRDEAISERDWAIFHRDRFNKTANQGQENLAYGHLTHIEMADQMYGLDRESQNIIGITGGARDRIYWLAAINAQKDDQIKALKEALEKLSPGAAAEAIKDIPLVHECHAQEIIEARARMDARDKNETGGVARAHREVRKIDPLGTLPLSVLMTKMRQMEKASFNGAETFHQPRP